MDTEQCVEMMKALSALYKRASESNNIPSSEINKLKHVLTEVEMFVSSMRKSMDILDNHKIKIDEKIDKKIDE